jgi:SAM-dependent methyltransferase
MARDGAKEGMRRFWDDRARENAAWYVDTSCSYDDPDMDRFWETGRTIVAEALTDAPLRPVGSGLAVEIGPGLGRVCLALADHFDRVVGIDVSSEMIARARTLVDDSRVSFEVGNGRDLRPLADSCADLVVTFTVFQHLPDESIIEGYIQDAARVLRPGGVLAAQWNNLPHPNLWKLQGMWWRMRRRLGSRRLRDERTAPQFLGCRVPVARIREMCERAGLTPRAGKGEGTLFAWVWAEKR